ncbi:DUF3592 domain-containing protein [Streptomyces orinoci]|uniref:DUF3592 domain-containing protein n=1 Tax=Streptomyces orinoci TaxID=67339 RepID=A0ABV3JTK2_STRON|nr:DUF3592 domain-containing protein [Streptomyces orinoci]
MWAVIAVGTAPLLLGGALAYLAGAFGLRESRRLRRVGVPARALVRHPPAGPDDLPGEARPLLQFATEDGRIVEVFSPVPSSRSHPLPDGREVLIAYDPADPRNVLVRGRERYWPEYVLLALGAAAVLAGLTLLAVPR